MSHERSFSVNINGKEVLLPGMIDGKENQEEAIRRYRAGMLKPFGVFKTPAEADAFAKTRSFMHRGNPFLILKEKANAKR